MAAIDLPTGGRKARLLFGLVLGAAALAGAAIWGLRGGSNPVPPPPPEKPGGGPAAASSLFLDALPQDESGFYLAWENFFLPRVTDPSSLEHIRACYDRAGYRGAEQIEADLGRHRMGVEQAAVGRVRMAKLYLYEGDWAKASAVLADVRAAVQREPALDGWLPPVLFLQAVAALRRGETENCVECGCDSSCIFPLRPAAVHRKRAGAEEATRYLTEYLRYRPEDLSARWLLNICAMTLGRYPDGVPADYLIPPSAYASQADIGRFRDIAPQLGLNRLNQSGGAIMDDFTGDGLLDIVVTNMDPREPMAFYKNRGDGTFVERGKAAGLDKQLGGLYCVQTDYNNDGKPDLFVCRGAWGSRPMRPSLLRNNGNGTFTDVTREAGLAEPINSQVAAWADYDLDGRLDLFVGGETVPSRLYRNRGDGTFEDVTVKAGINTVGRRCKGACWLDYDGDRYPDLFVSTLDGPPSLYHNNRDGTFTDVAAALGILGPSTSFPCFAFDYDNDGWPDVFVMTGPIGGVGMMSDFIRSYLRQDYRGEAWRVYRNRAGRRFEDVTRAVGLDLGVPVMGSNFADLDNDGFIDLYLGTGGPAYSMLIPNLMFKNDGGRRFLDITTSSGTGHLQKGHAVAIGDWDRDGNVDVFSELGGPTPGDAFHNVLFQNPGGHGNHWVNVKLVGRRSNRPGIGSRITVVPAGKDPRPIYRWVTSGSSFGANPLEQHVGIGKADHIARLEVYWPASDTTQLFRNLPADQWLEITEGVSTPRRLVHKRLPVPEAEGQGRKDEGRKTPAGGHFQ